MEQEVLIMIYGPLSEPSEDTMPEGCGAQPGSLGNPLPTCCGQFVRKAL